MYSIILSEFFLMHSDSEVQKLKGFGFGEISTSANTNCFFVSCLRPLDLNRNSGTGIAQFSPAPFRPHQSKIMT